MWDEIEGLETVFAKENVQLLRKLRDAKNQLKGGGGKKN